MEDGSGCTAIVIDVGCARYGGDYSIERLIEEFHPDVLYGFDPSQGPEDYPWESPALDGSTLIHIEKKAAWTFDGWIGFHVAGLSGKITEGAPGVQCFDLARFITEIYADNTVQPIAPEPSLTPEQYKTGPILPEIILKVDAEGAEYELFEHLIETGAAHLLSLVWVEWHPPGAKVNSRPDKRRESIESLLSCEVHQWNW
jgi:hypothetical protein